MSVYHHPTHPHSPIYAFINGARRLKVVWSSALMQNPVRSCHTLSLLMILQQENADVCFSGSPCNPWNAPDQWNTSGDDASESANPVFMCIRSHVHQLRFWPNVHFRGARAGLLRKGTQPDSFNWRLYVSTFLFESYKKRQAQLFSAVLAHQRLSWALYFPTSLTP